VDDDVEKKREDDNDDKDVKTSGSDDDSDDNDNNDVNDEDKILDSLSQLKGELKMNREEPKREADKNLERSLNSLNEILREKRDSPIELQRTKRQPSQRSK
jgi:hypothetical protein